MAGSIPESDLADGAARLARAASAPARTRRWKVLRRAARARLAPFGAAVMVLAVLVALAAPLVAPHDPLAQNLGNTLAPPGRSHLLGTDNVGRDVLSRVIWGTRISLLAGLVPGAPATPRGIAGRGYLQQAPWIVFGPGAALFVTVVGLNFVGDAVRDALDPRTRE